jgi:hypothetical protein
MKLKVVKNEELSFNKALAMFGQAPLKINYPEIEEDEIPKPFIKWAGGKRSLIRELHLRLPASYNNYYEPFVGGGAFFCTCSKQSYYIRYKLRSDYYIQGG